MSGQKIFGALTVATAAIALSPTVASAAVAFPTVAIVCSTAMVFTNFKIDTSAAGGSPDSLYYPRILMSDGLSLRSNDRNPWVIALDGGALAALMDADETRPKGRELPAKFWFHYLQWVTTTGGSVTIDPPPGLSFANLRKLDGKSVVVDVGPRPLRHQNFDPMATVVWALTGDPQSPVWLERLSPKAP